MAGVHIYLDSNDVSYVSNSFIAIHTWKAGPRTLVLPEPGPLYDLLNERDIGPARSHALELNGMSTAFFFRGTAEQWRELEQAARR